MDQVKEILRQAIKYRFWIALGISALLPMIAYFVGVGPVQTKAAAETATITSAEKDVKQYTSGNVINAQYKPLVSEKTEVVTKDVDASWKKLYKRQAPLLTWPDRVQDRFTAWGRKWPENVDPSAIQIAIIDYVNAYPAFVTEVYKTFKPFDPVTGEGIVSAPPEAALLRPATFTIEAPPPLGKVWASQERLWIQRTLLDVIAKVNADAKDWDGAIIKQINGLEVGSPLAQDQRSLAKGDTLEEAAAIDDPSKPAEPEESSSASASGSQQMMGMGGGMPAGYGGRGGAAASENVAYIKTESSQFKIMPVQLTVLIDQDHIQDLLVALENSPMTIQVMDFEWSKPGARVTKPEKGQQMSYGMGGYGDGGMMGMGGMMMGAKGGRMGGYGGRMMGGMMGMGAGGMGAGYGDGGMMGMGGMGGAGGGGNVRKGVDARSKNYAEQAKEREAAATKGSGNPLHDPYYTIVEVKITGQARFFNPPPAEEAPASQADAAAAPTEGDASKKEEPKTEGDTAKKDEAKKDEGEPAKKDEAAKEETSKKEEAPKAEGDATKKDEPAKPEAPKADGDSSKKDEAAKPEGDASKKDDAPKKDETPKKDESAKTDAPPKF